MDSEGDNMTLEEKQAIVDCFNEIVGTLMLSNHIPHQNKLDMADKFGAMKKAFGISEPEATPT